jgi:hypothetical protein
MTIIIRTVKELREILQYVDGDRRLSFCSPGKYNRDVEIGISDTGVRIFGADGRKNYTIEEIDQSLKSAITTLHNIV